MIICPSCSYPNGESDHRCERCGRRFDSRQTQGEADDEVFLELDGAGFDDFSQEVPEEDDVWGTGLAASVAGPGGVAP